MKKINRKCSLFASIGPNQICLLVSLMDSCAQPKIAWTILVFKKYILQKLNFRFFLASHLLLSWMSLLF